MKCKRCGKEMTKQVSVPCPDNKPGCCVYHFRLVCDCEYIQFEILNLKNKE